MRLGRAPAWNLQAVNDTVPSDCPPVGSSILLTPTGLILESCKRGYSVTRAR